MKRIIEIIARALVDEPDAVSVVGITGPHTSILELNVGKIIGKQGRIAGSRRTIMNAVSAKMKRRSQLEIIE